MTTPTGLYSIAYTTRLVTPQEVESVLGSPDPHFGWRGAANNHRDGDWWWISPNATECPLGPGMGRSALWSGTRTAFTVNVWMEQGLCLHWWEHQRTMESAAFLQEAVHALETRLGILFVRAGAVRL